tara:strand:+ start:3178 stop:3879 length:702 start_codon:yes stop_codon:yes gene_type:complete
VTKGCVYLIPVLIDDDSEFNKTYIAPYITARINNLDYFVVENVRTARRFIKKINPNFDINNTKFVELNKRTNKITVEKIINTVKFGTSIGLMSESGCPGIADPGSEICSLAHKNNIKVKPLIGPCSIILALMASGLGGQNFSFHGYLPIEKTERIKKIKKLCKINYTHIFIETPYRNNQLLEDLIKYIEPKSKKLTIASNVTSSGEIIITKRIEDFKKLNLDLNKKPTIFIFE